MGISVVGRLATEVAFVCTLALVAGPFWSCLRSPAQLRRILADASQLRRIIDRCSHAAFAEAQLLRPLLISYGLGIELRNQAHCKSVSWARNYLGLTCLLVLAMSAWLGSWYFVVSAAVFLFGMSQASEHAETTASKHVAVLILDVINWSRVDGQACARFCTERRPEYSTLYRLLPHVRAGAVHALS